MLDSQYTAIDSLQLRIDLGFVKFTPEGERLLLNEYFLTNSVTGEVNEDTLKKYAYAHKDKGITSRFLVRKAGYNQKLFPEKKMLKFESKEEEDIYDESLKLQAEQNASGVGQDLEMILNSKMLKSKYIYGITQDTIEIVYKYIIDLGLFELDFNDFLTHSRCTDIDIKTDLQNFSTDKTIKFFSGLNVVAPTKALSLNPEKELIIQYGYRRNEKKVKTNPFVKMYHKMVELRYNSLEFYREHLKPIYGSSNSSDNHLNEICRIEGQIKDNSHLQSLLNLVGLEGKRNNLHDLLLLTENNLKQIISILLNKQINISNKVTIVEKQESQNKSLSVMEKDRILAIKYEIMEGGTIDTYIFHRSENMGRSARYNFRKKAIDLYKTYLIKDNEVTQKNEFRELLHSVLNMS